VPNISRVGIEKSNAQPAARLAKQEQYYTPQRD
jgi:hypothetical protein